MDFFARQPVLRRSVALILAAILSTGCMTWRPLAAPQMAIPVEHPARVRATLEGGQVIELYSPTVLGNDLIAWRQKGVDSSRVVIPMRSVQSVVARQVDGKATGWLIAGVVAVGVLAVAVIATAQQKFGGGFGGGF